MKKILIIFIIIEVIVAIGILAVGVWVAVNWNVKEVPVANVNKNPDDKSDLIVVDFPKPNQTVKSPLMVVGQARGTWFFEASFPVVLTNWDGLIIAQGMAQANPPAGGDWMTENFVPFEATLNFTVSKDTPSSKGFLILKKDNPSGLPANDNSIEIPVVFEASTEVLPINSGVEGQVLLGPTCPVQKYPPDTACADKPYETTVQLIKVGSPQSSPFITAKTDKNGNFKIALPSGNYALQAIGGQVLPRCTTVDVTVKANIFEKINLSCDTGIR